MPIWENGEQKDKVALSAPSQGSVAGTEKDQPPTTGLEQI